MSEQLNIYQKLAKIRKPVEVMKKDSQAYGYSYVNEEAILAQITGAMAKYHVALTPSIVPQTLSVSPYEYKKIKKDKEIHVNEILVQADMVWRWVNEDDPSDFIEVPWAMTGQQADASQAFGSGLTYSSRYFLLKYFNVATTNDDPDNWRSRQKEAEHQEDALVARGIVAQIHKIANELVENNEKARPELTKLVKKYTKKESGTASANYFAIKNPDVATELLDQVKSLSEKFAGSAEKKTARKGE